MRIGFCGLALSHPFTFAGIFEQLGVDRFAVWDADPERVDRFRERHPGAEVVADPATLGEVADGVMVCSETADHLPHAKAVASQEVPVFVDKPLVTRQEDLRAFDELSAVAPLWCASVLRFAPALASVLRRAAKGDIGQVAHVEAAVNHTIAPYLEPGNTWQDEPDRGGGTIATMGAHGMELVAGLCALERASVFAVADRVRHEVSQSEDTAHIVVDVPGGPIASISIIGGADVPPSYGVTAHGSEGSISGVVPDASTGDDDHGYAGCAEAFLGMIDTRLPPVEWSEVRSISAALLAARSSSAQGVAVEVDSIAPGD